MKLFLVRKSKVKNNILLLGFFLSFILFPKIIVAETLPITLHSVQEGGSWYKKSTWIENRIPVESDNVEINGVVSVGQDYHVLNLSINADSELKSNSPRHARSITISESLENNGKI